MNVSKISVNEGNDFSKSKRVIISSIIFSFSCVMNVCNRADMVIPFDSKWDIASSLVPFLKRML